MKRIFCLLSGALICALILAGCATIVAGTSQTVTITSNVDDATIYLDGERIGTTPFTGKIKKGKSTLRVEKTGYRTGTVTLSKTLETIFWGNIIIGGTIGSITDFASGAAYAYAPATYQVDLRAEGQSSIEFRKQVAVRKFSMIYTDEISRDLAAGQGDYLSALTKLLDAEEESSTVANIRSALEMSQGNQVIFGQMIVDLI